MHRNYTPDLRNAPTQQPNPDREAVQAKVDEYLAKGGKITHLGTTFSQWMDAPTYYRKKAAVAFRDN